MQTNRLYDIAEQNGIEIDSVNMRLPSLAVEVGGLRAIALRQDLTLCETRAFLSHEIGHHIKGALYNKATPCFSRGQCEYKANKWAVHKIMPYRSLLAAMRRGVVEIWQLADYFDVTADFVICAIRIYQSEGKLPA